MNLPRLKLNPPPPPGDGGGGPPPPGGRGGGSPPLPGSPIQQFMRPRGLPILVPQNLVPIEMPPDLPKFSERGMRIPSWHTERYIERMTMALITNEGYWLVWFPTTLDGEAYEWYRDHDAGHFVTWDQLLREFLTEYMPEVDQSTALRTLAVMRQGDEESITAYIRRFEVVRSRYVGVALNEEGLRQFFIQGFAKPSTVRSVMKRNPVTVADAKLAAKEVEQFEKDYKLWRREDESIPQFVPIRPMMFNVPTVGQEVPVPHVHVKPGPQSLATRAPKPMLALPAPKVDTQIADTTRIYMS